MLLLNMNIVMIFVIISLSDKGLSPKRKPSSSESSSSQSNSPGTKVFVTVDIPLQVTDTIAAERENCKRDIFAVFDENSNAYEHAKHAIKNLTIFDRLNFHSIKYYQSLYKRLSTGQIISVAAFCRLPRARVSICKDEIREIFKAMTAYDALNAAFYDLNLEKVKETGVETAIRYFYSILNNFEFQIEASPDSGNFKRLQTPQELCEELIKMPKKFKKWDTNPDLTHMSPVMEN